MRGEPLKWYDDNAPDNPPWLPVTVAATSITTAHLMALPFPLGPSLPSSRDEEVD